MYCFLLQGCVSVFRPAGLTLGFKPIGLQTSVKGPSTGGTVTSRRPMAWRLQGGAGSSGGRPRHPPSPGPGSRWKDKPKGRPQRKRSWNQNHFKTCSERGWLGGTWPGDLKCNHGLFLCHFQAGGVFSLLAGGEALSSGLRSRQEGSFSERRHHCNSSRCFWCDMGVAWE